MPQHIPSRYRHYARSAQTSRRPSIFHDRGVGRPRPRDARRHVLTSTQTEQIGASTPICRPQCAAGTSSDRVAILRVSTLAGCVCAHERICDRTTTLSARCARRAAAPGHDCSHKRAHAAKSATWMHAPFGCMHARQRAYLGRIVLTRAPQGLRITSSSMPAPEVHPKSSRACQLECAVSRHGDSPPCTRTDGDAIRHAAPLPGEAASACTRNIPKRTRRACCSSRRCNLCLPENVSTTQVTSRTRVGRSQMTMGRWAAYTNPARRVGSSEDERAREGGMQRCPSVMRAPRSLASLLLPVAVVQARPPPNQTCSG